MKIRYIITIAMIIAFVITSVYLVAVVKNEDESVNDSEVSRIVKTTPATPEPNASSPVQLNAGTYQPYSDAAYADAEGTRVLFFYASWCSQCRALDTDISNQAELAPDTTIFKVDFDTAAALRKKYDVTLQTTLVRVDQDGTKTHSYVAYDQPTYENMKYELGL